MPRRKKQRRSTVAKSIPRPKVVTPPTPRQLTHRLPAEPDEPELIGQALIAEFSLIECPTWSAAIVPQTIEKGGRSYPDPSKPKAVDVVPEPPEWPHTHGGVCQGCGQLVAGSELTGCPKMKEPGVAAVELMKLKMPADELHAVA